MAFRLPACQSLLRQIAVYNAKMKAHIVKNAAINASLTALYIAAVSFFLSYGSKFFDTDKGEFAAPAIMLCLLVFSAAVTASLIFGRPVIWYMDGKKKEALSLLAYTLGIFLGIIVLILVTLVLI